MARIEWSPGVFDDFERFRRHLEANEVDEADIAARLQTLTDAVRVLAGSPELGRAVPGGARELVVGTRSKGYVLLYRFVPSLDLVLILAARHQRERGFFSHHR